MGKSKKDKSGQIKKIRNYLILFVVLVLSVVIIRAINLNVLQKETDPTITVVETTQENTTLHKATVERVVDGDTVYVVLEGEEQKTKVRLIGVNTPESVSSDESKNCEEGEQASEYTKTILSPGKVVYLEYDKEDTDKYDRTLAYIWLQDGVETTSLEDIREYMFNAKLLLDGQAEVMIVSPNNKYEKEFKAFEEEAQNNQTGFWATGYFS